MAGNNTQTITISIQALMGQTLTQLTQLNSSIAQLEEGAVSTQNLTQSFDTLKTAMGAITAIIGAWGIKEGIEELTELGATSLHIAEIFEDTFNNIGLNAEEQFNKIKEASKGLIDDDSLKQSVLVANELGIPLDKLAELMEVARVKSKIMGTTVTDAFADIAKGIGRGSPMILDNLGLIVKLGEVNEEYAKSIGKTVAELNKQELTLALTNSVIKAGASSVLEYKDAQLSAKEETEKLDATISNLKGNIGIELVPIMQTLTKTTEQWLSSITTDDIKGVVDNISLVGDAFKTIFEIIKTFDDIAMPDIFTDEDKGLLDTVIAGYEKLGETYEFLGAMQFKASDATEEITTKFRALDDTYLALDSSSKKYEQNLKAQGESIATLKTEIEAKVQTLKESKRWLEMNGQSTEEYDKAITELQASLVVLKDSELENNEALKESKKAKEDIVDVSKKEIEVTKELSKEHSDYVAKILKESDKRLTTETKNLNKLEDKEKKLYADLAKEEEALAQTRQKFSNERISIEETLKEKIRDLNQSTMNDAQKLIDDEKEAYRNLSESKRALEEGNLELSKKYLSEYNSLVEANADKEIEKIMLGGKTRAEAIKLYSVKLQEGADLSLAILDVEESRAIDVHNASIDNKKIEIDLLMTQITLQKEMLEIIGKMVGDATGKKFEMDFSTFDSSVKTAKASLDRLEKQKRTSNISVKADTNPALSAINRVNSEIATKTPKLNVEAETRRLTSQIEKIEGDISRAELYMQLNGEDKEVRATVDTLKSSVEAKKIELNLNANTKSANTKVADFKKDADTKIVNIPLSADIEKALFAVDDFKTFANETETQSIHDVSIKSSELKLEKYFASLDEINTNSVHTITVKTIEGRSYGGLLPALPKYKTGGFYASPTLQHRAEGGSIGQYEHKGVGRVKGYDASDSDDVFGYVPNGSFVINREASNYYGIDNLEKLSNNSSVQIPTTPNVKLTRGEFIYAPSVVDREGLGTMNAINNLELPKFATGGVLNASTTYLTKNYTKNMESLKPQASTVKDPSLTSSVKNEVMIKIDLHANMTDSQLGQVVANEIMKVI